MTALLLYVALAVVVSFLCSLLEAAFLSLPATHIEVLVQSGRKSGLMLAELKRRLDRPLAAILTLNTVANTVGAAGVGAQAMRLFGSQWVAVASGALTLVILVFSEIIPKTLGAAYSRRLSGFTAYAVRVLMIVAWPAVLLSERIASYLSEDAQHPDAIRAEMVAAAEMGETAGALLNRETRIIKNLVRLEEILVEDVMTPRAVMLALQQDLSVAEAVGDGKLVPFSRIPIYGGDIDDVRGFVHRYRLLEALSAGEGGRSLASLARPIQAILPSKSVADALDEFIARREHIFLVIDEYGGTEGIVTLEDAVETLLGVEIVDEYDSVEDLRKLARAQWEKRRRQDDALETSPDSSRPR